MLDLIGVLFIAVWGWVFIEVARRTILMLWRDRQSTRFGLTIEQYRAYKKDLRDRNG